MYLLKVKPGSKSKRKAFNQICFICGSGTPHNIQEKSVYSQKYTHWYLRWAGGIIGPNKV